MPDQLNAGLFGESENDVSTVVVDVLIPLMIGTVLGIVTGLALVALFAIRLRVIGFPWL